MVMQLDPDRALCVCRVYYLPVVEEVCTVFVSYPPKPNSPLLVLCYLSGMRLCRYLVDIRNYQTSQDY